MFGQLTPITKNIIILNVMVYFVSNFINPELFYTILPAYYPGSPNFHSWQIITHMFMHAPLNSGYGITHILFNMLTLWSFGPVLENYLKEKRYLILYFASGLGAFILFNVWNYIEIRPIISTLQEQGVNVAEIFSKSSFKFQGDLTISARTQEGVQLSQQLFNDLRTPMLGASGAIFGVVAAFSTLFPDSRLIFMFIPYPIKAKYLFPIIIVVSLYLGFSGEMSGVAHFAHIGGAIVGFVLAKIWGKNIYRIR